MARSRSAKGSHNSTANLGFQAKLRLAADKLRSNMDAAEYKHVVLGLIFHKYISDAFEEKHAALLKEAGADPEDQGEYISYSSSQHPPEAACRFDELTAPLMAKIKSNSTGSRTLGTLRDTLLPKLLSGELRIAA